MSTGAAAAGYLLLQRFTPIKALYQRITSPILEETPAGLLDAKITQTLLSAAEAFINISIEKYHYNDFFNWRAKNLPGYKNLYEQFAMTVEQLSVKTFSCNFTECTMENRRRILESMRPGSRLNKLRLGTFKKDWLLFEKHIFSEILLLFAKTDAWILLGYESWPGEQRGLVKYRQSPDKT